MSDPGIQNFIENSQALSNAVSTDFGRSLLIFFHSPLRDVLSLMLDENVQAYSRTP
jgi:hypothetical protein